MTPSIDVSDGRSLRHSRAILSIPIYRYSNSRLANLLTSSKPVSKQLEIKAVIYELLNRFEFSERDPGGTPFVSNLLLHYQQTLTNLLQVALSNITIRMIVEGEREKGVQLPLRVKKLQS